MLSSCEFNTLGKTKKSTFLLRHLQQEKSLFFGVNVTWEIFLVLFADCSSGWLEGPNKVYIPFLACGDLTGYDSDRSYPLPKEADGSSYQSLDPVQPAIAPPYKRALELKKASAQSIRDAWGNKNINYEKAFHWIL